jgi:hypothetical protein
MLKVKTKSNSKLMMSKEKMSLMEMMKMMSEKEMKSVDEVTLFEDLTNEKKMNDMEKKVTILVPSDLIKKKYG